MRTQNLLTQIALVTIMAVFGVGCAKQKSANPSTPGDDPGVGPTTPPAVEQTYQACSNEAGASTTMTEVSREALTEYAVTHPLNNPDMNNIRLTVKLQEYKQSATNRNQYFGKVTVTYRDNNQDFVGRFETKDRLNCTGTSCGNNFGGYHHAFYNNWFWWNGEMSFHGFFSDPYGAVMVIVDEEIADADGGGTTEVGGEIWFKNYYNTQIPYNNTNLPCWYVTSGPYDCRTFLRSGDNTNDGVNDGHIDSQSALYPNQSVWYTSQNSHPYVQSRPDRGWTKLGRFGSLKKGCAFKVAQ